MTGFVHLFLWESPRPEEYITSQQIRSLEEGGGSYIAMAHSKTSKESQKKISVTSEKNKYINMLK